MSTLIGDKAPDFTVPAVLGNGEIVNEFSFSKHTKGKYAVLFFYPLDFTFVCPSELIALDKRFEDFKNRNAEVIGISIDSHYTHNAWRNTSIQDGGIGPVKFTLAADINHSVCRAYDIEHPEAGVALRGAFIIDVNGIVRAQLVNDLPIGRNIDELIRLVDAVHYHSEHGDVCPAGWKPGNNSMKASPEGVSEFLTENIEVL